MSNFKRKELGNIQLDIHKRIIEQCVKGSRKAQYNLYKLYSKAMYNICFMMMNNREEAEDILQDSFIDAFTQLSSFKFDSTFGAWLKKIVINKCINAHKKKKADIVYFENLNYFEIKDEEINFNDIELSIQKIKKAMKNLPNGGRMIFSLYLLEGYDHAEIAQILNITESTSKTQYMRAKNRIKELIITNKKK